MTIKKQSTPKISVKKNYLYNLSYQVLNIIVPIITTPYLARTLHPTGNGIYSYTHTIAYLFSLFASLGVNSYGQREIAYNQDNKEIRSRVFWELYISRIISVSVVLFVYILFSVSALNYRIYFLWQSTTIISVLFDISWLFAGVENYKITAVRNAIIKLFTVILIFTVVKDESDLIKYILIIGGSTIISGLYMFAYIGQYVKLISFKEINITKHLRGVLEFFVPVLAVQLYSQVDKIMLGTMCDIDENGYYEQARKISHLLVTFIVSINTVLYSRISYLFAKGETERIGEIYKKSFSLIIMLLAPVTIGLFSISDNFTLWFLGPEYNKVSILLRMSCILVIFQAIGNFVGVQYLNPTKQQNKATVIYIISAIVNILLNYFLIPAYFSIGALIASIIAELLSCVLQYYFLAKSELKFKIPRNTISYLIIALIMGLVVWGIDHSGLLHGILLTVIEIAAGGIIYLSGLVLIKDDNLSDLLTPILHKIKLH